MVSPIRSLTLALVAITCDSPVTPAKCGTPGTITTYSRGYEVERNICFESPDSRPPYSARSSDSDVASATSNGTRLLVTGGNPGEATITVSAGQTGTVSYPVVTEDPWTLESFECTVEEGTDPSDGFPEGYYDFDYTILGKAEVDLAELSLRVYVDDFHLNTGGQSLENLGEGQEFGIYVGGSWSKTLREIDVNDYECTVKGRLGLPVVASDRPARRTGSSAPQQTDPLTQFRELHSSRPRRLRQKTVPGKPRQRIGLEAPPAAVRVHHEVHP